MIDFVNIENVPLVTKMVYVAYSHEDNVKRRQCYLLKILDKRFAGINLVHLKRSRGPSPPQANKKKVLLRLPDVKLPLFLLLPKG